MALVMPTRTDLPHYDFTIDLDGVTFGFEFRWNDRDGAWYFSIADVNGSPLLSGRRVVLGIPLLSRFRDPRLPAGELTAIDTLGTDAPPGITELGARVRLLYFPASEIPAAFLA